jgi:hypothetical protein
MKGVGSITSICYVVYNIYITLMAIGYVTYYNHIVLCAIRRVIQLPPIAMSCGWTQTCLTETLFSQPKILFFYSCYIFSCRKLRSFRNSVSLHLRMYLDISSLLLLLFIYLYAFLSYTDLFSGFIFEENFRT